MFQFFSSQNNITGYVLVLDFALKMNVIVNRDCES